VNCSGLSSGYCVPCSLAGCDSEDQYRVGCGGLYTGYCALCDICPYGMYRIGCSGTSPGSCSWCLPCPAGKQRKGCYGANAGNCKDCSMQQTYILIADASANMLRRLTIPSKKVETIAGLYGSSGSVDGTGSRAKLFNPAAVAYIPARKVTKALLTDRLNHVLRFVDLKSGSVTTFAGANGMQGILDGSGTQARFNQPFGLVVSSTGQTAYVTDYAGHTVRSIQIKTADVITGAGGRGINGSSDGIGTEANFFNPCGLALVDAYLFLADSSNHLIRRINVNTWAATSIAGSAGTRGYADGVSSSATFSFPMDLSVSPDGNFLFVADRNNNNG
jgi:DNA-binding beta-propeller fold protein YncE